MNVRRRLSFVDGLRGIAAGLVVIEHLYGRIKADVPIPLGLDWLFTHGYLGVAIFFVLSGFVISMSIGDRTMSAGFLARFAFRRQVRLDPPYWASIVVSLLLAAVASALFGVPKTFPTSAQLGAHLFYLQDLLGYPAIVAVYWTLCLEVQFYAFLILVLWAMQAWYGSGQTSNILGRRGFQGVLAGFVVLSLGELTHLWNVAPAGAFLPYWFCFTLGALAYWVQEKWMPLSWFAAVGCIVFGWALASRSDWCAAAVLTAALLFTASRLERMHAWLSDPYMQFLGRISYSLYLFHATVGWVAMSVALKYLPPSSWWAIVALAVGISASVTAAWLVYLGVERSSVRWSHLVTLEPKRAQLPLVAADAVRS